MLRVGEIKEGRSCGERRRCEVFVILWDDGHGPAQDAAKEEEEEGGGWRRWRCRGHCCTKEREDKETSPPKKGFF